MSLSKVVGASVTSLGLLLLASPARAACPGDLEGWKFRVPIKVSNAEGWPTVTNYGALLELDTATLIDQGRLANDAGDLRIADENCTVLASWVEGPAKSAKARIWFRMLGDLPSGSSRTYYAYMGREGATRVNDVARIFGEGLLALYTFGESGGTTLHDSVGGYALVRTGAPDDFGRAGGRQDLHLVKTFADEQFKTSLPGGPPIGAGDFTVVTAAYPNHLDAALQGLVGNYRYGDEAGWVVGADGVNLVVKATDGATVCDASLGTLPSSNWYMVSVTRRAGVLSGGVDGATVTSDCSGDALDVTTGAQGAFQLGNYFDFADDFRAPWLGSVAFAAVYDRALSDAALADLGDALSLRSAVKLTVGPVEELTVASNPPPPTDPGPPNPDTYEPPTAVPQHHRDDGSCDCRLAGGGRAKSGALPVLVGLGLGLAWTARRRRRSA